MGVATADNEKPANSTHPAFKYSETATDPIIEYNLVHDMIAEPDPEPLLRVYGSGRVHVHYPAYMKKAGDYELQLSKQELKTLIRELADDGVIDFDRQAVKHQRDQLEKEQRSKKQESFSYSDESHTVINIRLDEYQKSPGAAKKQKINKQFSWPNLKQDARRFPGAREINDASRAAGKLESLKDHHDLVRVR